MNFEINSIWADWRLKVPNGVPNISNDYHLVLLKELCLEQGIDTQIIDDVILVLEKTSTVAQDAEKAGLQSIGGGYYSKSGKKPATHKSLDGKLVDLGKKDVAKKMKKEKPKKIAISKTGGLGDEPTDDIDRDSTGYKAGKQKFDFQMENMYKQIQFENDKEKEIFGNVLNKIKEGNLEFTDEEKSVAQKYMAKSDSQKTSKLYIAKRGPRTYDAKNTRGQIPVSGDGFTVTHVSFMHDIVKTLELGEAPAQAQTAGKVRVTSKVRTKDISPVEVNPETEDLNVKINEDSDCNVTSVTFGSREHKIKPIPDKQKLKQAFIEKGMSEESAEKKARQVRRAIRKHNEYLLQIAKDRDKFTVSTMIEGADPATEEGRERILNEYPKKLADFFEKIVKSSPEGISEDEQKVMDRIRNLDPNSSPEEYEKEVMVIMHDVLSNTPALASGASDLAESLIALIQIRKGHEVYFPADVISKVGDMMCLGSIGDLDPTAEDYYDRLADEASSIIVTVEDEGPGSIKVREGAASSAEEKVKLTEYKNPKTRQVLNRIIETHQDLFKKDPIELEEAKEKIDEAEDYARKIGISEERINEINDNAEAQARKWAEKYKSEGRAGTEDWTDEDWELYIETATQFVRGHLLLADINNHDMDYQKFTNFRVNNSDTRGASMTRTDGVDCLGTIKPAPNVGFTIKPGGRFTPSNTYAGRIGNTCTDKKKK